MFDIRLEGGVGILGRYQGVQNNRNRLRGDVFGTRAIYQPKDIL